MSIADSLILRGLARRMGMDELPDDFPRKAIAGGLSVLGNIVFFVLLFRHDLESGDPRLLVSESGPVLIAAPSEQSSANPDALRASTEPAVEPSPEMEQLDPASLALRLEIPSPMLQTEPDQGSTDVPEPQTAPAASTSLPPSPEGTLPAQIRQVQIAPAQQSMLSERMVAAAEALSGRSQSEVSWSQDGQMYRATLTRQAADSMGLENIVAEVTAAGADGTQLKTQLTVQRLAFSQFTQMVDNWDSHVHLHDDEIVGRFHSNSPFAVAEDSEASPRFAGKVTTSAPALTYARGSPRRRDKMFEGGLQVRTSRIELPQQSRPFAAAPEQDAYLHAFSEDAHITFYGDGTYRWRSKRADAAEEGRYPHDRPSYFIAANGVVLFVHGVVNGKVMVYSPERIVIEGNLIYADNPRTTPGADDYLGLVSDRNVQIAPPFVTGRGDLHIHAAIFAGNRFLVTNIDFRRTATLFIYGSLTAKSISATEPRYATKIAFDPRFDRTRPPGFPNTNRYEVASWDASWRETAPPSVR
jgi:hypothetical protein